jgi:hypothetical protein
VPGPLPDQTPVNFVKAGDTGLFFSGPCVKALAEIGLEPTDFGSYSHVRQNIHDAKEKCEKYDKGEGPPPSEREKYLANCASGHLMQDAVAREAGERGNDCANVIDGFDSRGAPSCPMEGDPGDATTEHGQVTLMEREQAGAAGDKNTISYSEKQRQKDEDARIDKYVEMRKQKMKDAKKETDQEGKGEKAEEEFKALQSKDATQAAGSKGAKEQDAAKPAPPKSKIVDANNAADCIKNWRKKAEAEMKEKCKEEFKNDPDAAEPSSPPSTVKAKQEAMDADRRKKWRKYFEESEKKNPDEKKQAKLRDDAMAASQAQRKYCRALQGKALAEGRGRTTGRVPCNAIPPKKSSAGGGFGTGEV